MKYIAIITLVLSSLTALVSCKEIIAKNIENDTPVLLVPSLNDTVLTNPVQFKWEALDGAEKYHLEVVSPSFSSISFFAIDTFVYGTEYWQVLDSNEYEVRLTAINAGYTSNVFGPTKFWVGVSGQTSVNQVQLVSPSDSVFVNASFDGPFSWQTITDVSSFEFSLREGTNFSTGDVIDFQNGINTININLSSGVSLTEGTYIWGTKAYLSSGTETQFSTRKILVDTTDPNIPVGPFSPTSFETAGFVSFSWNNGIDNGTIKAPVNSILEISDDPTFATITHTVTVSGSSSTVDMTLDTPGTYYWTVYNEDEAGNVSNYSTTNQFSLN